MSLQIIKPYIHVEDANGSPYVGALLYIYSPGTTTLASVYTDEALTVPAANPATSDAAGNFPRIYIPAGTYKLRAVTSANVLIWQEDNIDTGLSAGTGALPISRGGTGATTAAAAIANLGAASASSVTALASSITTLQSSIQNIVSIPQGYLTPISGTPVITTGVTAGTAVYYTPFRGNLLPLYDGTQFNPTVFAELTLTLVSNHLASAIYDVFGFNNSGSPQIATGPAYATSSAGSGARGTGAGTTELARVKGLLVNANSMTARNGSTTYTIDVNKGTCLGSIFIDAAAGQITCHKTYGQSRKWSIFNVYNRVTNILRAGDSNPSWNNNNSGVFAMSNNNAANKITIFTGLAEELVFLDFTQNISGSSTSATQAFNGIGVNSTSTASGSTGTQSFQATAGTGGTMLARHTVLPTIGINDISMLEQPGNVGGTRTYTGTEANMLMTARWMG